MKLASKLIEELLPSSGYQVEIRWDIYDLSTCEMVKRLSQVQQVDEPELSATMHWNGTDDSEMRVSGSALFSQATIFFRSADGSELFSTTVLPFYLGAHSTAVENLAGSREYLYHRIRLFNGTQEVFDSTYTNPVVPLPISHTMGIHPGAFANQLGASVDFKTASYSAKNSPLSIKHEAIIKDPSVVEPGPVPDGRISSKTLLTKIRKFISQYKSYNTAIRSGDENVNTLYDVYVSFLPTITADAPYRVNWFTLDQYSTIDAALFTAEAERQYEISSAINRTKAKLKRLGVCSFVSATPAAHAAFLKCSEHDLYALASDTTLVRDISLVVHGEENGMTGVDFRSAKGAQVQAYHDSGYKGFVGLDEERPRIVVAMADMGGFYPAGNHPALRDEFGESRLRAFLYCDFHTCTTDTDPGRPDQHGAIASIGAFANLMYGQDPNETDPVRRNERTWCGTDADLYAYRHEDGSGSVAVMCAAMGCHGTKRPDIQIVTSAPKIDYQFCQRPDDLLDWRDAWDYAYSHGVLGVLSQGNRIFRDSDRCTANGHATRSDLVMVGMFADNYVFFAQGGNHITDWVYDEEPLTNWDVRIERDDNCAEYWGPHPDPDNFCIASSLGGGDLKVAYQGGSQLVSNARGVVDVMAPSDRQLNARYDDSGLPIYFTDHREHNGGTSYSAPTVAAAIVNFLDWAKSTGQDIYTWPGATHANVLLMADGTGGGTAGALHHCPGGDGKYPCPKPEDTVIGMHRWWGAGRFKMRLFDNGGMDSPWGHETAYFKLMWGATKIVSLNRNSLPWTSDIQMLKAAIAWDEPYMNSEDPNPDHASANIELQIVTTEPINGSCLSEPAPESLVTLIAADRSFDVQKRIILQSEPQVESLIGKCVWIRIIGHDITPARDGGFYRDVYLATYFENTDRTNRPDLQDID